MTQNAEHPADCLFPPSEAGSKEEKFDGTTDQGTKEHCGNSHVPRKKGGKEAEELSEAKSEARNDNSIGFTLKDSELPYGRAPRTNASLDKVLLSQIRAVEDCDWVDKPRQSCMHTRQSS